MPKKSPEQPQEAVLSRELLTSGFLQHPMHAGGAGLLWTNDQIDGSLTETMEGVDRRNIWLFAYGSLIWNPIFAVAESRKAKIYGFHRAFCLSSVVGRGSIDGPGIMLALDAGGSCSGVALKVGRDDIDGELRLLWRREMLAGSYAPRWVKAHSPEGDVQALTFVANRGRANYVGRLPDEEIVRRLVTASGLLGSNLDYLQRTHKALEAHRVHDPLITRLLQACLGRQANELNRDADGPAGSSLSF